MSKSITSADASRSRERRRRPLHILATHDLEKLMLFYLGLDFDRRRSRFGAAVSDQSIIRHCRTLDWDGSIILGRNGGYFFDAILEIHPLSQGWDVAEIVLTCALFCKTTEIFSQLVQLAALLCGQRNCRTLLIARDNCCRDVVEILKSMATVRTGTDHLIIDLGDYTIARPPPGHARSLQAAHIPISTGELRHADIHSDSGNDSADPGCGSQLSH